MNLLISQQILKSINNAKDTLVKIKNPWGINMYIRISVSNTMMAFGYYPQKILKESCFNILIEKPYQQDSSTDIQFTENQIKEIHASLTVSFPKLNNNYLKFFTLLHENGLIK